MRICPGCNNVNDDSVSFCSNCGEPLRNVKPCKTIIVCNNCQANNDGGAGRCAKCNSELYEEEEAVDTQETGRKNRLKKKFVISAATIILCVALIFVITKKIQRNPTVDHESKLTLSDTDTSQTYELAQTLKKELEGYGTVREWFVSVSEEIKKYELTDAEDMKLNDLAQRVSKLDVTNYEEQLTFLESAKSLRNEVLNNRPLLESIGTDSAVFSITDKESATDDIEKEYSIETEWDLSKYPEIILYVRIKDANNGQIINFSGLTCGFSWKTDTGKHWSYIGFQEDYFSAACYCTLLSDQTETADELLEEWNLDIYLESEEYRGDASVSFVPAEELSEAMLSAYLNAYISDIRNHTLDKLMQYIETDVPEDDNFRWTIFYQMRKEISNGFLNTTNMELKDFQINKVERADEQTLHIYSTERYDGTYEEPFSTWKSEGNGIADAIRQLIGEVADQQEIRVSAYITQHPEYLLRKSADGKWKFYSYTGDLSLAPNWSVYGAREVY